MTKRYRSLASLQRDNRRCRACALAGFHLESLPIFEGHAGQRAYLYGQAPGIVEGQERRMRTWDYLHCPPNTEHITRTTATSELAIPL